LKGKWEKILRKLNRFVITYPPENTTPLILKNGFMSIEKKEKSTIFHLARSQKEKNPLFRCEA
jgi:hypothetical protein